MNTTLTTLVGTDLTLRAFSVFSWILDWGNCLLKISLVKWALPFKSSSLPFSSDHTLLLVSISSEGWICYICILKPSYVITIYVPALSNIYALSHVHYSFPFFSSQFPSSHHDINLFSAIHIHISWIKHRPQGYQFLLCSLIDIGSLPIAIDYRYYRRKAPNQ